MSTSDQRNRRNLTSPCKGEVGGEAAGRGSDSRFARTKVMTRQARRLRNVITDAEAKLWHALRRNQIEALYFRRQHPIGAYVLDSYCSAIQIAIQLDGGQHNTLEAQANDKRRTTYLNERGIVVLRYWNDEVLRNLSGVLEDILRIARERQHLMTPSPTLPLSGGGSAGSQP